MIISEIVVLKQIQNESTLCTPKILTNFYRYTIENILYLRLVQQPQGSPGGGAVCPTHHRRQTTCPPGHLQHPMSQEGQKYIQGQQPPEPLPVHSAIILKVRLKVHQSWDREIENSFYLKVIRLLNSHH
jgi:hypothetical protein